MTNHAILYKTPSPDKGRGLLLLCLAASSLGLAGCATTPWAQDERQSVVRIEPAPQADDMMPQHTAADDVSTLDQAPGVEPIPQFPAPTDRDLKVITNKLSGGSVEIFTLDDQPLPREVGAAPMPMKSPQGIPMAIDPRVTVFPLDDYAPESIYARHNDGDRTMAPSWPNAYLPTEAKDAGRMMKPLFGAPLTPMPLGDQSFKDGSIGGENKWGEMASGLYQNGAYIFFGHGSDTLDKADRAVLSALVRSLQTQSAPAIIIEGYASGKADTNDPIRARFLNLKESMNRAFTVARSLMEKGVPADKITTIGRGDTKSAGQGDAVDRRVDILMVPAGS